MDAAQIHGGDNVVVAINAYNYSNQSSGVALSLGPIWWVSKGEVAIERGGGGSDFSGVDTSKLKFDTPDNGLEGDDIPFK
jgi:hypothetical protein